MTFVLGGTPQDPAQAIRDRWAESLQDHLAAWIDPVTRQKGMTRKQLAKRLEEDHGIEVTLQSIGMWLNGQTSPRPHVMVAVAAVLGVPPRYLFPLEAVA